MNTLIEKPMGFIDRAKAAGKVMITGKQPNPLASEPADKSRAALVTELNDWCVEERKFWKPIFDYILEEQKFAAGKQWPGSWKDVAPDQREYIGDMVQQMINRKTAALYAKNPTPEAQLKERMNFTIWDGQEATIDACNQLFEKIAPQAMAAHEAESQGQPVPPPPAQMQNDLSHAEAILADYKQGMETRSRLEKVAETGELLLKQIWGSQSPDMVVSAKQAVSQVEVSRVAFVKVMFKRDEDSVPTETANKMDFADKLATLQAQLDSINNDPNVNADDPKVAESELLKQSIQQQMDKLQQNQPQSAPPDENIIMDWLKATSVIIDRSCTCMKEFIGAHRIAHEIFMTVQECEKQFGISLRDSGAKIYTESREGMHAQDREDYQNDDKAISKKYGAQKVCVFEIQDKDTGLVYTICDGVKDFLKEPDTNEPEVNRFWSIVPLTFNCQVVEYNDPENDVTIYPRSDVRLMMPMQINVNKAGQEKRLHRAANRPFWCGVQSKFVSTSGQNDLNKLASPRSGHDVLMLQNLNLGESISDFIQPGPKQPFDQWLYDNGQDSQAMMLATGQQASDIGEQRPDEKATGQNIAAQSRATSEASNIDDLDFFFSTIAQMNFEMAIAPQGFSQATVQYKVGRGGVWPDFNRQDIADSIFFKIEAGSMGRPNQAAQLNKIQTLMPQLIQLFGVMGKNPEPLAKLILKEFDANIDLDALMEDAQVLPPPAPPQEAQKMPSVSISANLKDLAPTEHTQAVEKFYGIKPASPHETLINKAGIGKAIDAHNQNSNPQPKTIS